MFVIASKDEGHRKAKDKEKDRKITQKKKNWGQVRKKLKDRRWSTVREEQKERTEGITQIKIRNGEERKVGLEEGRKDRGKDIKKVEQGLKEEKM